MARFKTNDEYLQLWYMIQNRRFKQREMARETGIKHGGKISGFVRWLEGLNFVSKTIGPDGRLAYEVSSRAALLDFYARHRSIRDEKAGTFYVGRDIPSTIRYLGERKAVMCLTSALEHYDDYARDPELHAYVTDPSLIDEAKSGSGGKVRLNLYLYKYPDRPNEKDGVRFTSETRTIIDLYCNNMGYLAERLIMRMWN